MATFVLQAGQPASALSEGNTAFGLSLFGQLRNNEGNLFFSPFSVSCALAMSAAGARGETREELRKVLNLSMHDDADTLFERLLASMDRDPDDSGAVLRIANSLWPQKGETLRAAFRQTVETHYRAGVEPLDYRHDHETARNTINDWVADRTANRIPELLGKGTLTPLTRMVLANAIYFKGDWKTPFDPAATRDAPFYVTPGSPVQTPMMFIESRFAYAETDRAQCIELFYDGQDTAMTILLPRAPEDRKALEAELTPERLAGYQASLSPQTVRLHLPRFRINTQFTLNPQLRELGIRHAFAPGKADFSAMREADNDLHIDTVVHQAFVEVDETGTEAAAATGVAFGVTSIPLPATEFRADRPFLFWIRHLPSDTLLFMGRLEAPR